MEGGVRMSLLEYRRTTLVAPGQGSEDVTGLRFTDGCGGPTEKEKKNRVVFQRDHRG